MDEEKKQTPATARERQLAGLKPVQKGQVLNPNGKKPGTLNKVTQETKELLAHAAKQNLPAVNNAIDSLLKSDNEFIKSRGIELYIRILEYTMPKLSAMAVKAEGTGTGIIVIGKPADLDLPAIQDATVIDEPESDNLIQDDHE